MDDMRPALEQALRALRAARVSALHPDSVSLYAAAITRAEAALEQKEKDYERGFVDGMSEQAKRSVDRTVNRMVDVRQEEPVVVRAEALDLILEAAEVLGKVRVSCDAWEKYGLRDFLPDELTGTAGMLRDGSAFTTPPRREWQGLTDEEIKALLPGAVRVPPGWRETVAALEQALKEKNT
jgi:hypothetical protein